MQPRRPPLLSEGRDSTNYISSSKRPHCGRVFLPVRHARLRYAGEGPVVDIDLPRFARELDIGWLRDPRYAGTVSGRFRVDGIGTDAATMWLSGRGRSIRADVFDGALADADVSVEIADGSLHASYDGRLEHINPAIAFQDERFSASLTGTGSGRVVIPICWCGTSASRITRLTPTCR